MPPPTLAAHRHWPTPSSVRPTKLNINFSKSHFPHNQTAETFNNNRSNWVLVFCSWTTIRMFFQLVFFLLYISTMIDTQSIIEAASFEDEDENPTLKCHKRMYNYSVSQVDKNGKKCWDILSVMACWGRCDSNEIVDFRFPYKKSVHPVCVHYGRNKAFVILRNCEEGALPSAARYEYYEAADCKCQQCSSLDTSCEGLRYRSQRSEPDRGFKRLIRGRAEFY